MNERVWVNNGDQEAFMRVLPGAENCGQRHKKANNRMRLRMHNQSEQQQKKDAKV